MEDIVGLWNPCHVTSNHRNFSSAMCSNGCLLLLDKPWPQITSWFSIQLITCDVTCCLLLALSPLESHTGLVFYDIRTQFMKGEHTTNLNKQVRQTSNRRVKETHSLSCSTEENARLPTHSRLRKEKATFMSQIKPFGFSLTALLLNLMFTQVSLRMPFYSLTHLLVAHL